MVELLQGPLASHPPKRGAEVSAYAAPAFVGLLALLSLGLVAAPVLRSQADRLWQGYRGYRPLSPDLWAQAEVVQDAAAWQERPGSVFTTPVSRCTVTPEGERGCGSRAMGSHRRSMYIATLVVLCFFLGATHS